MFKELFELWSEKVNEAKTVKIEEYDRFKDRIVVDPDGVVQTIEASFPPRRHFVSSIAALVEFLKDRPEPSIAVWYCRNGVTVVLDADEYRTNTVSMELALHPQFLRLIQMAKQTAPMSQKDTIALIRLAFRGCGLGNLADLFRNVKFNINQEGYAEVQKTKVSVGKSTLAEFHGLTNIPDEIPFVVPVFDGKFDCREPVMVAIEPDPQTQSFQLIPFPGEIEAALQRAENRLGIELRDKIPDENIPIIFGKP